mmetsp:Transcript_26381/g.47367  ORF Transcript_26381/g.47367 Transcript_26381/m.47367 type:complete len:86 (+) Transcript_26381:1305-1562(+)
MSLSSSLLAIRKPPIRSPPPKGVTMPEYYPEMRQLNHHKVVKMRKTINKSPSSPYTEILAKRVDNCERPKVTLHASALACKRGSI